MKILHFADLHLDASFAASGMTRSVASKRREELRAALRRILDLAKQRGVDVVTIAGDLYEQERCTLDTGNFLRGQFERIAPTPILIVPGNHDPWVPSALYRQIVWPSNVFIFRDSKPHPYTTGDVTIWGAAHCSHSCRDDLIAGVRIPTSGVHILLLHASDTGGIPSAKPVFCPLSAGEVKDIGFTLALLGHYHGSRLTPADHPILCYPGSPEPLGFDEVGPHHVLFIEIEDGEVKPRLLEAGNRTYGMLTVDVSSASTREDVRNMAIKLFAEQDLGQAYVRLRLAGMLHPEVEFDTPTLLSDLSEFVAFLDLCNETYPAYDIDALRQDLTVKGTFVRKMAHMMEQGDLNQRELVRNALYLGLQAMDRKEIRPR